MSAFDLNPAGSAGRLSDKTVSFSQEFHFTDYTLFRHNEEPYGTEESGRSTFFDWNAFSIRINHLIFGIPLTSQIPLIAGFIRRITPHLSNQCLAVTWSDLFDQTTHGSVDAFTLSSAIPLTGNVSLGMTFYLYSGKITSEVHGDNHGYDRAKWASLENRFSGYNLKAGSLYKNRNFGIGFTIELPHSLKVAVDKNLSGDDFYEYLLPSATETVWRMPWIFGFGFSLTGLKNFLFTFDFESRQYQTSDVQFNLYEFGAPPQWEPISIIRAGMEFTPFHSSKIPLRLGYAHVPQLYCSNLSTGRNHFITSYENTSRNITHRFTFGSSFFWRRIAIDAGFEFCSLHWERSLNTNFLIKDKFTELTIKFITEIRASLASGS